MATDATGTPTSPDNIPTFNTAVDAPSGLGSNAQMAAIQTALSARVGAPAGVVSGEVPVWNGSAWVRSSATGMTPSGIAGYPANVAKGLRGDGSWIQEAGLIWDSVDAGVTLPAASMTTSTLPNTYRHLLITWESSSAVAAATDNLAMRINGDAGAHYYYVNAAFNSAAATVATSTAATLFFLGVTAGASAASYRGGGLCLVSNYTISTPHPITSVASGFGGASSSNSFGNVISGMKGDTGASISTLTFVYGSGSNFTANNTRISVYGL